MDAGDEGYRGSEVLRTSAWVAGRASDVSISEAGVRSAAISLYEAREKGDFSLDQWKQPELNPKEETIHTVAWIFVVDTLNFAFWSDSEELFTVDYNGKLHNGYWSLCAAINRALDEGIPITDASYMANVTPEQLQHVFRSATTEQIPLFGKRLEVLREAGRVLLERFGGSFVNAIAEANQSAQTLLNLVVSNFSSYNDHATYDSQSVKLYKRAQILVADLWAAFRGRSYGAFADIDSITMFADYRVPQGLVHLGVLEYSEALLKRLREDPHLPSGDRLEVEIRAASIWGVELVRREMAKLREEKKEGEGGAPLNAIVIDFYLWTFAKEHGHAMKHIPIHKTRSVFY